MKASAVLTDRDPSGYTPTCEHRDGELRTHIYANGVKHYVFECQVCGKKGGSVARAHWIIANLVSDPPAIDEAISDRYWAEMSRIRKEEIERKRNESRQDWLDEYTAYLKSAEWKSKASKVLFRDGGKCRAQLDGCAFSATQAHHLTYDHVFNEPLFDLIAVCGPCHDKITQMDRERRAA